MRAGLRTAALALCLVTAGCTGLFGTPAVDEAETVTPAPVPDIQPVADEPTDPLAPGLATDGVTDVDELVQAHVGQLSDRSYTVQHRRMVTDDNRTILVRQYTRAETSAGYDRYTAFRTIDGDAVENREVHMQWDNGTVRQLRTENGTTVEQFVVDGRKTGGPPRPAYQALFLDLTFNERIRSLFLGANVTSVSPAYQVISQLHGARVLRVTANGAADPTKFPIEPAANVTDVGFTAAVTPDGFVRSYSVEYTVVRDGERRHVTESLWYSDVGVTNPTLID